MLGRQKKLKRGGTKRGVIYKAGMRRRRHALRVLVEDYQKKSSIPWDKVVIVLLTFGLFSVNYWQAKTNRDTLKLLSEQQKYSLMKPRLIVSREQSRLSEDSTSFIIRVKNIGGSPACNVFLALKKPTDPTKEVEHPEGWAFIQHRHNGDSNSFDEGYLGPGESVDIRVSIKRVIARDLEGKTDAEKSWYFVCLQFDLWVHWEDMAGKTHLSHLVIGPVAKPTTKFLFPETAKALEKYKPKDLDWKIHFYENVDLQGASKKR